MKLDGVLMSAMKSGSTWMFRLCAEHPQVFIATSGQLTISPGRLEAVVAAREPLPVVAAERQILAHWNSSGSGPLLGHAWVMVGCRSPNIITTSP